MADKKISQLTALSAANLAPSTDVLAIVDTSATETKKIVAQDLVNGVLNVASAVGIGTASPGSVGVSGYTRLVLGAGSSATDGLTIVPSGTGGVQFTDAANVKKGYLQWDSSTGALALGTGGTTKATLDTSGNLGLGVTPSAWDTSVKVMEFPSSSLAVYNGGITHNAFFDSVNSRWEYRNASSNPATFLNMQGGAFAFNIAGNGTQNNPISFTQAMTLDASGNLGVGTTSPSSFGKLAVVGTSTGVLCAIRDEGTPSGNTFVVSSNANGSAIVVNSSGNVLFGKNISVGGATPTTSGTGITFPATQSASSNANTLDDYEEGTFTPVISGTTTAGTGTYNVQNGAYVKIGNLVQYQIYIILTAHTGTGNITITGLPFTAIAGHYPPAAVYVDNLALTANNYPQIAVSTSSTTFLVRQVPVGGGAATAIPMDTQFDILLSGTYQV